MNKKFKLSVVRTEYFYNYKKQTVTCKLHYRIKVNDRKMSYAFNYCCPIVDGGMYIDDVYTTVATAKTLPEDTFNIKTGEQIARAKAESQAYNEVIKYFNRVHEWYTQNVVMPMAKFIEKGNGVIEHNDRFIDSF